MKEWQSLLCIILGLACTGLSTAVVLLSRSNIAQQQLLQAGQQRLNNSVMAPQVQQIANGVLQDMAAIGAHDARMRELLARHGYKVQAAPPPDATPSATAPTHTPSEERK